MPSWGSCPVNAPGRRKNSGLAGEPLGCEKLMPREGGPGLKVTQLLRAWVRLGPFTWICHMVKWDLVLFIMNKVLDGARSLLIVLI